jgi:hypothetical protein
MARRPMLARLEASVSAWAVAWFGPGRIGGFEAPLTVTSLELVGPDAEWREIATGVLISLPARAARRLLEWSLDADLETPLTPADQRVLADFEAKLVAGLAHDLARVLSCEGEALAATASHRQGGSLVLEVTDVFGAKLFDLAIRHEALLRLCRSTLPSRSGVEAGLAPMLSSIASTPVTLDATLGSATVSLIDAQDLGPGDVVVLNRGTDTLADIVLAGAPERLSRARITYRDGQLALVLQP